MTGDDNKKELRMRRAQRFGEEDNAFGFRHASARVHFKVNHHGENYIINGKWNMVEIT